MCTKYLPLLLLLGSCAHKLKSDSEISTAPSDFSQNIVAIDESRESVVANLGSGIEVPLLSGFLRKDKSLDSKVVTTNKNQGGTAKVATQKGSKQGVAQVKTWQPRVWPFGVGEKITMALSYGVLEAGKATLEVLDRKLIDGVPVLHYRGEVKTSSFAELFYKVDDKVNSWVGFNDHLPRRMEIVQNESGRWGRRVVVFDNEKSKAKYFATVNSKDGKKQELKREDVVTPFAQDVFGALYYYRFLDLGEGSVNFPIHDRWKNWANQLTFVGREKIQIPLGEFKAIRYKMFPRVSGDLEPKGDVELWISDDERRLLLQFRAKIRVGAVKGQLIGYEPGRPFTVDPPLMKTPFDLPAETAKR